MYWFGEIKRRQAAGLDGWPVELVLALKARGKSLGDLKNVVRLCLAHRVVPGHSSGTNTCTIRKDRKGCLAEPLEEAQYAVQVAQDGESRCGTHDAELLAGRNTGCLQGGAVLDVKNHDLSMIAAASRQGWKHEPVDGALFDFL